MENEVKVDFKPSNWFLDEKKPEYYKNRFLNSCVMRIKQTKSILPRFNNIINGLDSLLELELSRDPQMGNRYNDLQMLKKDVEHCQNFMMEYLQDCQTELNELHSKDFEKYIEEQKALVIKNETKKD